MPGFSFCQMGLRAAIMGDAKLRLLITVITLVLLFVGQARAQQNYGSANYALPLCKTWLNVTIDADVDEVGSIVKMTPIRLTTSGMCAGVVLGISQTLQMFGLACPPNPVRNEQLVQMVVDETEKHPEQMHKDFVVVASEVMMVAWPCKK